MYRRQNILGSKSRILWKLTVQSSGFLKYNPSMYTIILEYWERISTIKVFFTVRSICRKTQKVYFVVVRPLSRKYCFIMIFNNIDKHKKLILVLFNAYPLIHWSRISIFPYFRPFSSIWEKKMVESWHEPLRLKSP